MKTTCRLLLVAVATAVICASTVVCTSAPSPAPAVPNTNCPWRTVPHPEDPFIQKLGSWAVEQEHITIAFEKVLSAKMQGVGQCTNWFFENSYYELVILASIRGIPGTPGGTDDQKYRAVVYVVNFSQPQKLISFDRPNPPSRHHPPTAN